MNTKLHSLYTKLHSLYTRLHSLYTKLHSYVYYLQNVISSSGGTSLPGLGVQVGGRAD
ncbi:hypothetical protein LOTGIDRAFT_112805 [Lottia gigantea]|uniref:Uncharacterized protein n=1 Tax=Lottia gigantea TaxID=225164 RepID=V4CDS7_LOTGI|nr:hypothetical protein LOTGIDRAFT_112805 [Lottia gigantea]ESP00100.1 hypothetical protein LOTGIDRAFT_112805 [Lottia gigantea]